MEEITIENISREKRQSHELCKNMWFAMWTLGGNVIKKETKLKLHLLNC